MASSNRNDNRLAPFNPTHESSIDVAVDLLQLQSSDILFDLGCGDGRLLLRAASRVDGLRCVGIELDESLVARGRDIADKAAVADRIEIRYGDVLVELNTMDATCTSIGEQSNRKLTLLDDATAAFVYLLPQGLKQVKVLLEEAAKRRRREQTNAGASDNEMSALRVASYMFQIPGWDPVQVDRSGKGSCPIYLYHL
jgi:precorrin-6B methylase 2